MVPFSRSVVIMSVVILGSAYLGVSSRVGDGRSSRCYEHATTIHDFAPTGISENPVESVPLEEFDGKVLLVLNVASFCEFTKQYHALNDLKAMDEFDGKFEILAFPCNQFAYQEPGENEYELVNSLKYVRPGYGYEPHFPMFAKIEVNGENEIPLFTHLKASCPPAKLDIGDSKIRFWTPFRNNDITWNFNKFLVDQDGVPYKRYDSEVTPEELVEDIRALLSLSE